MEFGSWYQINCGTENEWKEDFALMKDSGFDFAVLWYLVPPPKGESTGGDWRLTVDSDMVLRALREADNAGLEGYLGVWHPHNMGNISQEYRLVRRDGETINGPDIFNKDWLEKEWTPYLQSVGETFKDHPGYRGLYLDDTFGVTIGDLTSYVSYSEAAAKRFRSWLSKKYRTVENLNMRYKIYRINGEFGSFEDVDPPGTHEENLSLWMDWTNAREDWCEDFARITKESYRSADPDLNHLLVLSDQDYHMHTNVNHYGVNYARLMKHFDRFEIYMAAKHDMVGKEDLLSDVEFDVKLGLDPACGKPFQFHTWFNEPVDYKPMKPELLEAICERAAESGAQVIEIYVFKVRDWRITEGKEMADNQPPFKEISLKYQPEMLKSIRKVKEKLR